MQKNEIDDSNEKEISDELLESANGKSADDENEIEESDVLSELTYEQLADDRDNLKDRLMRSMADLENFRKRAERDRKDAELYGGTKLARDLLSVFDNMSRAINNIDDELRLKATALIEV